MCLGEAGAPFAWVQIRPAYDPLGVEKVFFLCSDWRSWQTRQLGFRLVLDKPDTFLARYTSKQVNIHTARETNTPISKPLEKQKRMCIAQTCGGTRYCGRFFC